MSKKSGDPKKVVNLADFRDEKNALDIKIGGYYAHPELGVHLHCIGVTEPMHTRGNEIHFVVEDHFGNLATFHNTEAPHGFVYSNKDESRDDAIHVIHVKGILHEFYCCPKTI